jgi:uncharacterized OB-fold protein
MSTLTLLPALTAYQCKDCQTLTQRSPMACARCLGRRFSSVPVTSTGILASWTTIRKPPMRFKSEGVYHVGVIDLDNGMRISGRLLHEASDQTGDRVQAVAIADTASDIPIFKVTSHG